MDESDDSCHSSPKFAKFTHAGQVDPCRKPGDPAKGPAPGLHCSQTFPMIRSTVINRTTLVGLIRGSR